ncbi:replication protein A 70 kDa DNA-binding subunit B-like [Primulina tabacum]|uniref:replication protein A 70 kDa DNA-binding subunit B-like n=1 Tax=Primulina tabacum TaxID=48773 RepID=UPI003F599749
MAPLFSFVREVEPSTWQWAFKLRLIRCYDLPPYENSGPTFECIFHDQEIFDDSFTSSMFEFKNFRDLKNAYVIDENELFDVIGKIIARDSPQNKEINVRATKLLDLIIEDLENNKLPCTLWENFVDKIMAYLGSIGDESVVVILQMCRARRFRGEVRVQSTFFVTKMIINGNLAEFLEFRNRMNSDCKTPTNSISTISMKSTPNIMEELSNAKDIFRTIEQVSENNEVGSFWVYARIVYIESHGTWGYLSCKKCPKKMIVVGDKFYCEKCDKFDTTGNIRFKIQVRVVDSTGNAIFLLWDRESIQLIGKIALELKTEMKNQESDLFSKLNNTDTREVEVLSSGDEVSTPIQSTSKEVPSQDVLNDSTLKRTHMDEFLSTAPDKKFKAIIKQEKD